MIVVDTSGVLAAKDENHPEHDAVAKTLLALPECDYRLSELPQNGCNGTRRQGHRRLTIVEHCDASGKTC